MKKIIILGAGIYQVPLIKKAKEMGIFTIVISIPGDYPGFKLADKIYYVNTTDYQSVLQIANEERVDGICTTGTDIAIITIGKVCDALGLRGVSEEGAKIACNKMLMKQVYLENGVNTAEFFYVPCEATNNYLKNVCEKIGYPVIFKAVDSSGSRGITKVSSEDEIEKAAENVRKVTKNEEFLIEKYLDGEEFGAQAFVQDGKVEFVIPHGDFVYKGDTGVPIGHYAPYEINGLDSEIYEQVTRAIQAMKLDNCAINADFMLCNGKVYVLEIGARGGATQLVELVSLYYGYNYYEKILRVALGEKVDFSPKNEKRQPNASHLIISNKSGIITSVNNSIIDNDNIIEVQFDYNIGDSIHAFKIGPDRLGHIITIGNTVDEAKKILFDALDNIKIEIDS